MSVEIDGVGQGVPRASGMYLARSSSWEKTVTTSRTGAQNVTTTYSSGTRAWNNLPGYGRTRHYNNGVVQYSYNWISTTKNYTATPSFKAPYLPGWTISTNVRYRCTHAMDYDIPSTWDGYLEIDVDVQCQPVDGRGQDAGPRQQKYYNRIKESGQKGRIYISPYSNSYTVDRNATVYYYMN